MDPCDSAGLLLCHAGEALSFAPIVLPEAALARLSGLPIRSPAKRSASREKAAPMHHPGTVPEAALAHLSGLPIRSPAKRSASREQATPMHNPAPFPSRR
ncbi:hypothetical protein [Klebsiella michiganensis]|uniref:Uncharacterized protein n=2 Tax=Klebsiella michiganensis TaxID=1134687 RepID=A0AB35W8R8_9ENTR|nr:hypothetical protein [Klebsiella michiganensis]MBD0980329.1 hypothetical protein [Klebsiella michiganensis]MBZ7266032.1 hypothetical protein [Klebsiella michiganensis]MBZ7302149.1 hypothetical protein [Klebsiella michiganensis]MDU1151235.1 hypothetical protein [Klebsiella michiganensis]MDU1205183.1 hypothetical protein [Klebsiella michiganensis]